MPPLTITVEEIDEAAGRLEEALKQLWEMRGEMNPHGAAGAAGDVPAITAIYNQGIEERNATFETEPRTSSRSPPTRRERGTLSYGSHSLRESL